MSAAHAEHHHEEHAAPHGAPNNAAHFKEAGYDKYLEEGGVLPFLLKTAGLVKGVAWDAPKAAIHEAAGHGGQAHGGAHAKDHGKEHAPAGDHAKEGAAAEHGKDADHGHDAHGHGKKKGGGWFQETFGDLYQLAGSAADIYEGIQEGKLSEHDVKHAIEHSLDAANAGFAMPLGWLLSKAVCKWFNVRKHPIEKIDPQYDNLGLQILTGLTRDKKHGYHHAVEGLCHHMKRGTLQDKFGKFSSKAAFDEAMKTEAGRNLLKKQLNRIIGDNDAPHSDEIKERVKAIFEILGTEIHGTSFHAHDLGDAQANDSNNYLSAALFNMHEWMDDAAIKAIYHGEKEADLKMDYDKFGDLLFEGVKTNKQRESFLKQFEETPFKRAFRFLITDSKVGEGLATDPDELLKQINTLYDFTGAISDDELKDQAKSLLERLGKSGTDFDATYEPKFKLVEKWVNEITARLTTGTPSSLSKLQARVIQPRYKEFGSHVNELTADPHGKGKKIGFMRGYNTDIFGAEFPYLTDAAMMATAIKNESERMEAQRQLLVFLGLNSKTVAHSQVVFTLKRFRNFFGAESEYPAELQGAGNNYQALTGDLAKVEGVLTPDVIKQLFEGVKLSPDYKGLVAQLLKLDSKQLMTILNEVTLTDVLTKFSTLHQPIIVDASMSAADQKKAKDELNAFMGVPDTFKWSKPILDQMLTAVTTKIQANVQYGNVPQGVQPIVSILTKLKTTLDQTQLDLINAA